MTVHLPIISNSVPAPAPYVSGSPLVDAHARAVRYLRVSVTDRCNYRCTYCMPADGVELLPRRDLLTFEEIAAIVKVFARLGVSRVRLTGGEPTIRRDVVSLVRALTNIAGIDEVVMTTNAHRFPELAEPLARAGLHGINVSFDTINPEQFRVLTRRGDFGRVSAGVDAAIAAGLQVKLNTVVLGGQNDSGGSLAAVCEYAWVRGIVPRFIEYMPMSAGDLYTRKNHVSAAEIRDRLGQHFGARVVSRPDAGMDRGPARYFELDGANDRRFGVISAMTEHFCDTCNRVRITAVGKLHTCLAHDDAVPLGRLVRAGAGPESLEAAIRGALALKREGHEFQLSGAGSPSKHMVSIGG